MNLTVQWFITNTLFVTSFIITLFTHRAVIIAINAREPQEQIKKLRKIRQTMIIITILMFVAMCASFISNMVVNG